MVQINQFKSIAISKFKHVYVEVFINPDINYSDNEIDFLRGYARTDEEETWIWNLKWLKEHHQIKSKADVLNKALLTVNNIDMVCKECGNDSRMIVSSRKQVEELNHNIKKSRKFCNGSVCDNQFMPIYYGQNYCMDCGTHITEYYHRFDYEYDIIKK